MMRSRWTRLAVGAVAVGVLVASAAVPAGAARKPVASPSKGCGTAATPGVTRQTIDVDGTTREYLLEIPPGYKAKHPAPLIFNFHGLGSNMDDQAAYTGLNARGGNAGYIVITPNGSGPGARGWKFPPLPGSDVPFISGLLRRTEANLCINRNRVFSTGISAGGIFSTALACAMPGKLAAIAPVAGINVTKACSKRTPRVSVLAFHGTDDGIVPYAGGPLFSGPNPVSTGKGIEARPVTEAFADWVKFDGCASKLARSRVAFDVVLTSGKHCDKGVAAKLATVEGGGHTWPGAPNVRPDRLGPTTTSIDATGMILTFFGHHPKVH